MKTSRKDFMKNAVMGITAVVVPGLVKGAHQKLKKPNVVLMMADDLGWGDTGYNGNKIIKTPNLDRMSREGLKFSRFYAAAPVCSPTRASCLIGRHPYRTGVFTANNGILRPEEINIAEILKEKGYTAGHFGKWHLGTLTYKEKDANRGRPDNKKEFNPPSLHGFDVNFSTESKVPTWDPMKQPKIKKGMFWDYLKESEEYIEYGTYYWNEKGEKVTENLEGDDSRVIMDRAIPFIEGAVKSKKPFLAVIWFHTPHLPCVAGPKYLQMYKEKNLKVRNYAGCITAMDEQIGRLRKRLEELGVDENTMVWFCSDNGPENRTPGITGGYKGRKRSLYDGGVRVPGLLVWPEKIIQPMVTDIPCCTSDYLPTVMDVLNIPHARDPHPLDGVSLLPLIEGEMKKRPSPIGFQYSSQIAYSDNRYKLYSKRNQYFLYDMVNDPFEEKNIIDSHLEIVKSMKKNLKAWIDSCKDSFEGKEYGRKSYDRLGQAWFYDKKRGKGQDKKGKKKK